MFTAVLAKSSCGLSVSAVRNVLHHDFFFFFIKYDFLIFLLLIEAVVAVVVLAAAAGTCSNLVLFKVGPARGLQKF